MFMKYILKFIGVYTFCYREMAIDTKKFAHYN